MISQELTWQGLIPNLSSFQTKFVSSETLPPILLSDIQPRLSDGIQHFVDEFAQTRFMFIKSDDSEAYLSLYANAITPLLAEINTIDGDYQLSEDSRLFQWKSGVKSRFSSHEKIAYRSWIEPEQLFGYVTPSLNLVPGLLHQINGGILVIAASALISQPLMWARLKNMVNRQQLEWLPYSENQPLPIEIEPQPLELKVIIVGDRLALEEFEFTSPELFSCAIYGEYEPIMFFEDEEQLSLWMRYVKSIIESNKLPHISADGWVPFIQQAVRYCEDKFNLPLDILWLVRSLVDASHYHVNHLLTQESFKQANENRQWRHSFLAERTQDDILQEQIFVKTEGEVIGQVNGLSVLQYPGHPDAIGEPSRITCVAHLGDGEFTDVERKAELGGNIHAKGMMIMQAYLNYELKLEQPQPFSASIVFEQSYGEVDGDSASLAELCALISALSLQPIDQQVAITGAVDQFGYVQPIGGVNEKIEGFFDICEKRGLTGNQGVIIPMANVRHLCTKSAVVEAVKEGQFHIWPVEHVAQAITILTKQPYFEQQAEEENVHLLALIQERINQANSPDKARLPWFLKWIS
ncbi:MULTISPECIES: AAA family ATPase [Providencia]|uniref:endopeptidase La n=2 Tax=Providencia TaxID=586 RepID=A0AAD2VNK9_PRORE|nr:MULTISPECIES: Lon protease family protein [Providencia]ELR5075645.1 Lon protease family protein [Providencia stuartii]ELR5071765.1 Lon protease family protein [Providencia rettgeri]ELR5215954.1 Lon protease family protein [Providencia rettgeri]ELR5222862.1 Lon protease family protein [Providencia rettgeri]MDX7322704.1 Lon protease family protein [Providencia rettgeri]